MNYDISDDDEYYPVPESNNSYYKWYVFLYFFPNNFNQSLFCYTNNYRVLIHQGMQTN